MAWGRHKSVGRFEPGTARLEFDGVRFVLSVLQGRRRVLLASAPRASWRRVVGLMREVNAMDGESLWLFVATGRLRDKIGLCR
jgi:hypothetical protein